MKRFWAARLVAVFSLLLSTGDSAAHEQQIYCGRQHALLAPGDSSTHRKYAPDRAIDVLHLALDVTPDFKERSIRGEATLRFKPNAKALQELSLDGVELAVETVTSSEKVAAFQVTDKNVIVTFGEPIPAGKETTLTIK